MISECPHCNQHLPLSDANKERIMNALEKLQYGQTLKFKCPICKELIVLNNDGLILNSGVTHLGTFNYEPVEVEHSADVVEKTEKNDLAKYANTIAVPPPAPPNPPDISWLINGSSIDNSIVEDILTAMVIVPDKTMENKISESLKAESYQIYTPQNIDEAVNSIRFKDYAIIVYHSRYEAIPLKNQDFHKFIQQMSMQKRRYIYYILIGSEFHTLYDLEALANSANIVINDNEIKSFSTILTKGKADYKKLFNPYCSMLKSHGKS